MFDGSEFLTLASELLAQGDDEARLRCVISRAYYAAFLRTREYLIARGYTVRHRETHRGVWDRMANAPDPVARAVGHDGRQLQVWRRADDYDLAYPGDLAADGIDAINTARTLLANLESLP